MSDKNKLDFINLKLEDLNPKLVKSFKRSFTILHYVSFLNKKGIINETRLIGPTTYVFIAKRKEFAEDKGLIIKKANGSFLSGSLKVYFSFEEVPISQIKEVTIKNTIYVYDLIKIDKLMNAYGSCDPIEI